MTRRVFEDGYGSQDFPERGREMKQQVRVIKTQRDYEAAIARLSSLMDEDISPGSAKEAELELWALVIESYESNRVGPVIPDPIEAIIFRMDQQGLGKKDLVPYFGSLSKVSEVLSRKRPLSLAMIRKIHQGLGISAEVLLGGIEDEGINLSEEPGYDYTKFPWQEMLDRKFCPDFMGTVRQAKERGEELFRNLIRGIANQAPQPAYLRARMHQSGSRIMNEYALLVWQIAVLKKARSMDLPVVYKQGSITDEWLRDLAKLSSFEKGPLLAQEYLANAGIAFVVEEHFKKTYLDGAAMLDGETPVVALTLRHDRLDNFWFALIHELVHVQRHLDASNLFIADNLDDKTRSSKEEQEADAGARDTLIPANEWDQAEVKSNPTVGNAAVLAKKLRIHPSIVAGRVRYETDNWRLLTNLNEDVRKHFRDQLEVE